MNDNRKVTVIEPVVVQKAQTDSDTPRITEMFSITLFTAMYSKDKSDIRFFADKCYRLENQGYDEFRIYNNDLLIHRAFKSDSSELRDLGGYIVDAFAIALWGLLHTNTFRDGMLEVIRLGGDTDTNAACYGQLAGAYYGHKAIPKEWRDNVLKADELVEIADRLFKMKECSIIRSRFEDNEHFGMPKNRNSLAFECEQAVIKPEIKEDEKLLRKEDNIQSIGEIIKERFRNMNKDS